MAKSVVSSERGLNLDVGGRGFSWVGVEEPYRGGERVGRRGATGEEGAEEGLMHLILSPFSNCVRS